MFMLPTRLLTPSFRPAEGFYASEVDSPRRMPVLTFLPTGYEHNYPYPLLVFFHGHGGSEKQMVRLAPRVSRRNYICIGLRGPYAGTRQGDGHAGYSWGTDRRIDVLTEDYVFRAIELVSREYHIHPQRIFLAGVCEGATLAYQLGLTYPAKFAGLIALNGQMPRGGPLLRLPESRRLRVLIGHGIANARVPLSSARRDHHLLYIAGLQVQFRRYPTTHRIHPDMLRDIDRWVMEWVLGEDLSVVRSP
jgi:phospholipase/carboxylesterase